jgi:hypothetical protein
MAMATPPVVLKKAFVTFYKLSLGWNSFEFGAFNLLNKIPLAVRNSHNVLNTSLLICTL